MWEALLSGLNGLLVGFGALTWQNVVMMMIAGVLLYLGIKKNCEPLLLVPIGFGALLVNIPVAGLMGEGGLLRHLYDAGIMTEIFPCLIFIGIGAMTDFEPLLQNPRILILGAAGQFGIFLTLILALIVGFPQNEAVAVSIIGACDGPTAIFVSAKYAERLVGPISVAAYSYMSIVPIIMPLFMRMLTTKRERKIKMEYPENSVSKTVKILFPVMVTLVTCIIAPMGTALMGMIMLGNFMKETGVVSRLTKASENEIANVVTLLLGITIGGTMGGEKFLTLETGLVLLLGLIAICFDTIAGVLFGKLMCFATKGKINPLIGAAGISAYPMAARVVQTEGRRYDTNNWLLMHAMGANTGGQIGSVMAAGIMLSVLNSLKIM